MTISVTIVVLKAIVKGVFDNNCFGVFHVFYDLNNVYMLTPFEVIRILTFSFLALTSNPIVVLGFFLYLMFLHLYKGFVLKSVSLAMGIHRTTLLKNLS